MLRRTLALLLAPLLLAAPPALAAKRALFDNFHAEQAGNADWVIDNDQPTPLPTQASIVASTPRTYWTGAISSWGVDLVKRGFTVTTNNAAFTYGNAGNPLDLSNFDVLIVPEPNTLFSAAEATAILNFVRDGGGLIAVGDHDVSDRNNDGFDSPKIWNALDPTFLLGVHWGTAGDANNNFSQTSSNVNAAPSDSITRGPEGNVTALAFHGGTSMTLHPEVNPSVRGEVWMTGVAQSSLSGVMAASSRYGSGRVFFCGDSSPIDDGSANPGNTNIFDGWAEVADSLLFVNATLWATRRAAPTDAVPPSVLVLSPNGGEDWKAGSTHAITWSASDNVGVTGVDVAWSNDGGASFPFVIASNVANSGSVNWFVPDLPANNFRVRVTARDAVGNNASDASDANFSVSRWQISASAASGGTVTPAGVTQVAQGGSVAYSIGAQPGFAIAGVSVDGAPVGALSAYSFTNVAADHTISATFADIAPPSVALGSPNGGETWNVGDAQAIVWTASDASGVASVDLAWSAHGNDGPWQPIATGIANSGSHPWTVPAAPTDSALVRVTAHDPFAHEASDVSAARFQILDPNADVDAPGPAVLALARPQPNPSRGGALLRFSLPEAATATLELLDVSGRRVQVHTGTFGAGPHTWTWDGRDSGGAPVHAGLYLARLVTPFGTRTVRLARIR